jgi:hypothetical protein
LGEDRTTELILGREVDRQDVARSWVEGEQGARFAGAGIGAGADFVYEPAGHQFGDQIGDRHLGQPGAPGQVGAGESGAVIDVLQDQRQVAATGILGAEAATD